MDQTIIFDKSYEQRLQEYVNVFNEQETLSVSDVKKEWASYLESIVDPFGWQAIWKIPCSVCKNFKITYPTLALVYVDRILFEDLTATIKVLTVQNDITLPSDIQIVNLNHLWPTEQQDETLCLNLSELSNALDMLRFFYKHLWRPWDIEDDDYNEDWIQEHLEVRLRLYYDVKFGIISKNIAHCYRAILMETKEKYSKIEDFQLQIADDMEEDITKLLRELHEEFTKLKSKLAIFENPALRQRRLELIKSHGKSRNSKAWLIIPSNRQWFDHMEYMLNVKKYRESSYSYNTAVSLQQALEKAQPDDTIFIGSGTHIVNGGGNLAFGGGTIINVNHPKEAILECCNDHVMFELSYGIKLALQYISLSLKQVRYGIRVRAGSTLDLQNCSIRGGGSPDELSSVQRGITADNGKLKMVDCEFQFLATAISAVGSNSEVSLTRTKISDVNVALRLQDIKELVLDRCEFVRCDECTVHVETERQFDTFKQTGGLPLLESVLHINVAETILDSCAKPDVIVTRKMEFRPIRDVLSNPSFNTTLTQK